MARLSEQEINGIRAKADIVDVIGRYVPLSKKVEITGVYVRFMMIILLPCQLHQISRFINVLFAVQEGMYSLLYKIMKNFIY